MKLKRLLSAGLLVIVSGLILNVAFGAMGEGKKDVMTTGDNVASGQAVEYGGTAVSEGVSLYNSSSDCAYEVEGGYIYFDESTGTVTDCDTSVTRAVIPSEINGVRVTSIGDSAFYGCGRLTNITIPGGVTSIGDHAFDGCTSLTNITIPGSVTSIGDFVFDGCGGLISIEIPGSVTSIGDSAFEGCDNVENLVLGLNKNPVPSEKLKTIKILEGITSIENFFFYEYRSLTSVEIPEGVTSIGMSAFLGCSSLTSIEIPESVTSIGDYAFYNCNGLTSIEIPENVTSIGVEAFCSCDSLTSVKIPKSVTSIGDGAFGTLSKDVAIYCYKDSVADNISLYPDSATIVYIDGGIANKCEYKVDGGYIYFNESTGKITGCDSSVTAAVIPNEINGAEVTDIGDSAFNGCIGLTSIEIPESVTSIGDSAFNGCSGLTSIEIPGSVTSIGDSAFYGCSSLTSVEIPESVTSIGFMTFGNCSNLTSVKIPDSVTSIGEFVFNWCSSLKTAGPTGGGYNIEFGWKESIPDNVFDYSELTSIEIPESITSIGDYAFRGCSGLTSIEIPKGVISIGDYAFDGCSGLTSIEIPESVTSIENSVFNGCSSLTSIEIPGSVTRIGDSAFNGCIGLTSIEIPGSVISIGDFAFESCNDLTDVEISEGVKSIGSYVFYNCSNLTSVEVPHSVEKIWNYAFEGINENATIYCYEYSYADNADLYPDGVTISKIKPLPETITIDMTNFELEDVHTIDKKDYSYSIHAADTYTLEKRCQDDFFSAVGCRFIHNGIGEFQPVLGFDLSYENDEINFVIPEGKIGIVDVDNNIKICSGETKITKYSFLGKHINSFDKLVVKIGTFKEMPVETIEYEVEGGKLTFNKSIGVITDCDESVTAAAIPEKINGVKVKGIGDYAFYNCSRLTSITIPESVTNIENYAFDGIPENAVIYCSKGSAADNPVLYPDGAEIIYAGEEVAGDLNGDGKVTTKDAVVALQMSTGKREADILADVNNDNKVTTKDAVLILQYSTGKITEF